MLHVQSDNSAARLYERLGFSTVRTNPSALVLPPS